MIDLTDQFFQSLQGKKKISAALTFQLKQHIIIERFAKNTCLLKYGQLSDKMYFICQGAMRGELRDWEDGEYFYKSSRFMLENEIVFNVDSFINGIPSEEAIYTLEYVVALTITRDEYYAIREVNVELGDLTADLTMLVLALSNRRANDMQTPDTMKRLKNLIKNEPEWTKRVPDKYLASYIVTTPENFSRLLKKLREEEKLANSNTPTE